MPIDAPRIACFGGLHVDVTAVALGSVRPGTSNPVRTTSRPGGVATNVARVLARLGESVVVCSAVGDDGAGRMLLDALSREGVDASGVQMTGSPTARYTAVVEPDGTLFLGLADAAIYDGLGDEWVAKAVAAAEPCGIWMLDANLPAEGIRAVVAAAADRLVVADPVSVSKAPRLLSILDSLGVVFPDGAELAVLSGSADGAEGAAMLHSRGPVVVASFGAAGVVVADGTGVAQRPAPAVEQVADETGAGDALLAGYLHGVVQGDADPVRWGLAAAALAVSEEGSVPPRLTADAVATLVAARR